MMEDLLREAKKAERPLFAGGIDGLAPGIATILKDPREWNAVKPGERCSCHDTEDSRACDAHVVPNGSKIYLDEAWKWFGHLQNAQRQAMPGYVLELAEHRHRGIDFVWTFQQPAQIYPFARGLMGEHYHVVRRFGTSFLDVFKWEELNEDVKSSSRREAAQRTTRTLPADAWKAYKSAEVHTIKRKIPLKVLALPAMFLAAAGLLWFGVHALRPKQPALTADVAQASGAGAPPPSNGPAGPAYRTAAEYAAAHQPRIATMPWSAPVFDGRKASADPELFCMSSKAGQGANGERLDDSCSCMTEQGTPYATTRAECEMVAANGAPYNAYKQPQRVSQDVHDEAQPRFASSPSSAVGVGQFAAGAAYGADGLNAY